MLSSISSVPLVVFVSSVFRLVCIVRSVYCPEFCDSPVSSHRETVTFSVSVPPVWCFAAVPSVDSVPSLSETVF